MASVFDPLGFLAPVELFAKVLLQEIWKSGKDWDEPIDQKLLQHWRRWTQELPALTNLTIPRPFTQEKLSSVELHAFADASEMGFGAVLYLRHVNTDQSVTVNFISSKTRVARTYRAHY